jgi:hypothetical protein
MVFVIALVFLAPSAEIAQAQEAGPSSTVSVPAAVRSQADCASFIASPPVPRDLFVLGGHDDDFHSSVRQFVEGDSIFISPPKSGDIAVGAEYSVVRPAHEVFRTMHYRGERSEIAKLGEPYEDIAKVRVTHVSPKGEVAIVTFSCGSIVPGDRLMPFQPRAIPEYTISKPPAQSIPGGVTPVIPEGAVGKVISSRGSATLISSHAPVISEYTGQPLDPFASLDSNKAHGRITASRNNYGFFGEQTVVYLSIGENDGARPGQRFRIYKALSPHTTGYLTHQRTPLETIGEAVVLSVQPKSCTAMVVSSSREISAGDYVEEE